MHIQQRYTPSVQQCVRSLPTLPFSCLATCFPEALILDFDVDFHWLKSSLGKPLFANSTVSPEFILDLISSPALPPPPRTSLVLQALCCRVLRQEECWAGWLSHCGFAIDQDSQLLLWGSGCCFSVVFSPYP